MRNPRHARSLVDAVGRPLLKQDRLRFLAVGDFEGVVEFVVYDDAIEARGQCVHCDGRVDQLLRLPPSDHIGGLDDADKIQSAQKQAVNALRRNHDCRRKYDDKQDVDDFLRGLE